MVSNRNLLFQGSIFRGYVSFREGEYFIVDHCLALLYVIDVLIDIWVSSNIYTFTSFCPPSFFWPSSDCTLCRWSQDFLAKENQNRGVQCKGAPWQSLGGGNSNILDFFSPDPWGRWTHFDEHIFQRGWLQPPTRLVCGFVKRASIPRCEPWDANIYQAIFVWMRPFFTQCSYIFLTWSIWDSITAWVICWVYWGEKSHLQLGGPIPEWLVLCSRLAISWVWTITVKVESGEG